MQMFAAVVLLAAAASATSILPIGDATSSSYVRSDRVGNNFGYTIQENRGGLYYQNALPLVSGQQQLLKTVNSGLYYPGSVPVVAGQQQYVLKSGEAIKAIPAINSGLYYPSSLVAGQQQLVLKNGEAIKSIPTINNGLYYQQPNYGYNYPYNYGAFPIAYGIVNKA